LIRGGMSHRWAALVANAGDWPMKGHDAAHSGTADERI